MDLLDEIGYSVQKTGLVTFHEYVEVNPMFSAREKRFPVVTPVSQRSTTILEE